MGEGRPTKLILENRLSPGDIVVLTAAVRDLHAAYPGRFVTDVRTSCPALWKHNPHITPIADDDPGAQRVECHYPLIHKSNDEPWHFIHGFHHFLSEELGVELHPLKFKGDIHVAAEEADGGDELLRGLGVEKPYWVLAAGGKYDYTIKWWIKRRWQAVVDHFAGEITFVRVGEKGHYHPPLRGVTDLRGMTDLRQLVRLIYHSDGVVCPVTLAMHLAAAVPRPPPTNRIRPCVVINGGREPPHWEAYPGHQFLHTIGMLDCCADGACWRSRTAPLNDGSELDKPGQLCLDVTPRGAPRCMDMITADDVIRAVEQFLTVGRTATAITHRNPPNHKPEPTR